jgi:uncharacterized protein YjbI with pentapeptide repeats/DNA-binding XRE family transcriptional regulator
MNDAKIVGERIAVRRKFFNMTQTQLSDRLAVTPQAVSKWERGESLPDILLFARLAACLETDLDYLVTGILPPGSGGVGLFAEEGAVPLSAAKAKAYDMSAGNWKDADFSGLKDLSGRFSYANVQNCGFSRSGFSGTRLKGNKVTGCDFSLADMRQCEIGGSYLFGNSFRGCSLTCAEFVRSCLKRNDFSGADLSGALFRGSIFEDNILTNTVFARTSFEGDSFVDIEFSGAMTDCGFTACSFKNTRFVGVSFKNVFFKNQKMKRTAFIDCAADTLTLAFLKNNGADISAVRPVEPTPSLCAGSGQIMRYTE